MDARTGQGRGVTVVVVFVGGLADSNSSSNDKPGVVTRTETVRPESACASHLLEVP
jgi:hypothetical protein